MDKVRGLIFALSVDTDSQVDDTEPESRDETPYNTRRIMAKDTNRPDVEYSLIHASLRTDCKVSSLTILHFSDEAF